MEAELRKADNMAEMFRILMRYYDLDNCKPGAIVKGTMILNLQRGVTMLKAKFK